MKTSRDKRVDRVQVNLLMNLEFFAPGVARLPVVWDEGVPVACTDGKRILWNPKKWDEYSDAQNANVYVEEVGHCLMGHLWRAPEGADPVLWNQACDHALRWMLKDFSKAFTDRGLADPFPLAEPEQYAPAEKYKDWAEEEIYADLVKERAARQKQPSPKPQPQGQPKAGGSQKGGSGGSGGQKQPPKPQSGGGQGKPKPGAGGQQGGPGKQNAPGGNSATSPDPGNEPGIGPIGQFELKTPQQAVEPEEKARQSDWQNALIQAVKMGGKGQGKVPGSLVRQVKDIISPRQPWWELVRSWLREQAAEDWSWMRPNQNYSDCEFILPSLFSESVGAIVFGIDSSGSIDDELLAHFREQQQTCLDEMRPRLLIDIVCDSSVQRVTEYRVGDAIKRDAPGGGGTDFRPVFEHAEKLTEPVKCLVFFTDLQGTFPDKDPGYPVLWVNWSKYGREKEVPFGMVIDASEAD